MCRFTGLHLNARERLYISARQLVLVLVHFSVHYCRSYLIVTISETKMASNLREKEMRFITTPPPAPQTLKTNEACGVNIISVSDHIIISTAP